MFKKYIFNILIAIDQLANVLLGGATDMTISARLHRNYCGHPLEKIVDWMFSWQKRPGGHCENAEWHERDEDGSDAIFK